MSGSLGHLVSGGVNSLCDMCVFWFSQAVAMVGPTGGAGVVEGILNECVVYWLLLVAATPLVLLQAHVSEDLGGTISNRQSEQENGAKHWRSELAQRVQCRERR